MEELKIIYDHYKETCKIARENEKIRNKLFIIVCIIIGFLFMFSYDNNSVIGLIKSWVKGNYNCDLLFSSNVIQAILWIILFFITLRYLGLNINLDRSYVYIHNLEKQINKMSEIPIITREGESYLNNYPVLNNITYYMYRIVIPIIYYFVIIQKLKLEYIAQQGVNISITFQTILGILCIVLILTYLIENIIDIVTDIIKYCEKHKKQTVKNEMKTRKSNKKKENKSKK